MEGSGLPLKAEARSLWVKKRTSETGIGLIPCLLSHHRCFSKTGSVFPGFPEVFWKDPDPWKEWGRQHYRDVYDKETHPQNITLGGIDVGESNHSRVASVLPKRISSILLHPAAFRGLIQTRAAYFARLIGWHGRKPNAKSVATAKSLYMKTNSVLLHSLLRGRMVVNPLKGFGD